ncbi:Cytochrome C and Quinol oxidase polypeptide I [compost metagenome]
MNKGGMRMGIKFIKVAVVYFVIGVLMGMYMSMKQDYTLAGVHVHVNLLGWVSFALSGIVYILFPKAEASRLTPIQFWIHNIGFPVMMLGLTFVLNGATEYEPVIAIGATLVVVSVILFAVNVLMNVRSKD